MGLITKEVYIGLGGSNVKYLESLGYIIPKENDNRGRLRIPNRTKILVKTEDLQNNSTAKVDVECDCCGERLKHMPWQAYIKYIHEDGKYYCKNCAMKLYGGENLRKSLLNKNGKSFQQWCIDNNRQDVLDRWDYELNKLKPSEIGYSSNKKYYFKCPRRIHDSELKNISNFVNGQEGAMKCNQCNSFAQWGIDNLCEDFLEKYWDYEKNKISPWKIPKAYDKKVWIKCQEKDYHESYDIIPNNFINNCRCPYCNKNSGKIHPLDSLRKLLEDKELLHLWSNKNKKSPYKYSPHSGQDVYWKCPDGKHKDYRRKVSVSNICDFRCPECVRERMESFLQEKVRLYLNELGYIISHERNCSIIPQNPKFKGSRGQMPFDNEIVELKLIIEVHGIQHYEICTWHKKHAKRNNTTPEYELHMQKVRDRYKCIFAKSQGYFYLEIPYWTDNKDETWKKLIDDNIEQILSKELDL